MTTPRKAIQEKCFECITDPQVGNGTKREQTTNCTSYQCPLYNFRPITLLEKSRRKDEKLNAMSKAELDVYEGKRLKKAAVFRKNISKPNVSTKEGEK